MKKEIHYVRTDLPINQGFNTWFKNSFMQNFDVNWLYDSKLLDAFKPSLVSGLNENKK